MASDVNDAPDTGPADDQAHGGKPGDRPLPAGVPPLPNGDLPDLGDGTGERYKLPEPINGENRNDDG
jgi:hypothetical protein